MAHEPEDVVEGREPGVDDARDDAESDPSTADFEDPDRERPDWLHLPGDLRDDQRELVRRLGLLLWRTREEEAPPAEVEELAETHDPGELAEAVGHLHESLDRVGEDGPAGDGPAEDLRARLNRLTRALWPATVDAELRGYHTVLRDISHDIRSPLNSILFLVDGLYGGRSGPLTDVQREQIGVVYSASASLLKLVNDLLDFARIAGEEGGGDVEAHRIPFSVESVLADVRRLVSPIAQHQDCDLDVSIDVSGPRRGDPQILSRVLVNLVSNAISAAGEEGEVEVRVDGDDETLRVDVLDDGDDADLERIRDAVSRRASDEMKLTRVLSGQTQGLGLVICGRMVRQVGGDLEVDVTEDGWTRLTVELPYDEG